MFKRLSLFVKDVKTEIKKVVFPSKDELIGSTWVVIITTLVVSVFLGVVDWGLSSLVKMVLR